MRIIALISFLFLCFAAIAQPRLNIKHQIQRCLDENGDPVQNCCIITDTLGRQTYVPCDTLMIREVYADGDSLCFVFFDTVLCVDGAIGGSLADKNFAEDDLLVTGPRAHNQDSFNVVISEVDSFKWNLLNASSYVLIDGDENYLELFDNGLKMRTSAGQFWRWIFSGNDYILVPDDDTGFLTVRNSGGDELFAIYPQDGNIFFEQYGLQDKTDVPDFILGHKNVTGQMISVDSQALADFVGLDNAGVSGRIDNYIQTGDPGGGLDQQVGLQYNDVTYIMRLDSAMTINGVIDFDHVGLTPTTVKVLKSGILEFDASPDTSGVREVFRVKPLHTTYGNVNFGLVHASTWWEGALQHEHSASLGMNVGVNAGIDQVGVPAQSIVWEYNYYDQGCDCILDELHYVVNDSSGFGDRIFSYITERNNKPQWYGYYKLSNIYFNDPTSNNPFFKFQYEGTGGSDGATLKMFETTGNQSKGAQITFSEPGNAMIFSPIGLSGEKRMYMNDFNQVNVDKLRIQTDWGTTDGSDGNPAYLYGGESFYGGVVRVTYQELIDSLANYSDDDNMFSDSTLICIITQAMDTICADTSFFDESGEFCVVLLGDTTCIQIEGDGITYYNGNSSLSSDRTVQMADHYSWWRNGNRSIFQIDPDSSESSVKIWSKPTSGFNLELLGTQHQTKDFGIDWNGVTSGSLMKDYQLAVDVSDGALRLTKSNNFSNPANYIWSVFGQQDSMIIHKGLKLDGKVWDEDGDQGSTGDVLTKQADGTVNWAAAAGGAIPINNLLAADGTNTIDNADFNQLWEWDALSGNPGLSLSSNSVTKQPDDALLSVLVTGTLTGGLDEVTYAAKFENTHDGSADINYGLYANASGGNSNFGIYSTGEAGTSNGGIYGQHTDGTGIFGGASTGTGIFGYATSTGTGVYGQGDQNGLPLHARKVTPDRNLVKSVVRITSGLSSSLGTQNNFGASIDYYLGTAATSADSIKISNQIIGLWTDATHATRTSALDFYTVNSATLARKMRIAGNGQITLDTYGSGTHTGTATKFLAVTAAGLIIEEDDPGGPGGTDNIYNVSDSIDNEDRLVFVRNANTLEIELDTLASAVGADFMLTTQLPDTILRAGTDASGNSFLHLRPLIVKQKNDATDGIFIESTTTADEAATLNLRGRQDGTDNISSAIYFSNFDDDGGATSPTANLANIKLDRSVGDDEDGILTVNTYKVNGTETTHITADAISESTEINGFRMNQTTTAATSLTASATEQVIYATTSSGFTLTLPDADAMLGMPVKLYAPNASSVTITGGSGDTVTDYSSNFNRPLEMVAFGANLWTVQN